MATSAQKGWAELMPLRIAFNEAFDENEGMLIHIGRGHSHNAMQQMCSMDEHPLVLPAGDTIERASMSTVNNVMFLFAYRFALLHSPAENDGRVTKEM